MTKFPSQYKYKKPFWTLGALSLFFLFAYFALIGLTVSNTLARQNAEEEISSLSTRVSELEFSYLALKASVNAEMARSLGFVDAAEVLVSKKAHNVSISKNNEI